MIKSDRAKHHLGRCDISTKQAGSVLSQAGAVSRSGDTEVVHSYTVGLQACDKLLGQKLNVDGLHRRADHIV